MNKNINAKDKWIIGLLVLLTIVLISGILFGIAHNKLNVVIPVATIIAVIPGIGFIIYTHVRIHVRIKKIKKIKNSLRKIASERIKNLHRKEKVSLDNKAIFKAKDLKLINEVKRFLENKGLNLKLQKGTISKIRGGIDNSVQRGFLRIYNDIDLAIDTSGIKMSSEEYRGCVSAIQELTRACNENYILNGWDVKDKSTNLNVYVGLIVDYRFRISYIGKDKPKTQIDITFGEQDKDEIDNYWNKYLGLE